MTRLVLAGLVAAAVLLSHPEPALVADSTDTTAGKNFATAEDAVTALVDAVRSNKPESILAVLGPGSEGLVNSGDKIVDATTRQRFVEAYDEQHKLVSDTPERTILDVGKDNWPLPIPIVQTDGRWHFDTAAGAQELIDRRIGRDEIAAIRTSLTYVDAQKAFFALAQQVEGTGFYAQRLVSSPGRHDGLYWVSEDGEDESPLAPLVAQAQQEGYPGAQSSGKPQPYFGYYFRILTGQGPDSPGGKLNYITSGGEMTKGFALIAWPASYGTSGIMTFIVNQDGIVFQKDLGSATASVAETIKLFDPDISWARVDVVN
jgi:Protein of unknown function (DUF2950)